MTEPHNWTVSFPFLTIMAFVAVVLLLEGLYLMWNSYKGPEAKKIEQRLRALSAGSDSSRARRSAQESHAERSAGNRHGCCSACRASTMLDRLLLQSGLEWTVAKLLHVCCWLGCGCLVMLSFDILLPFLHAVGCALAASLLPFAYVRMEARQTVAPHASNSCPTRWT